MPFDRKQIIISNFWTCQTCGERVDTKDIQIAHKIKQDKTQKGKGSVAHIHSWIKDHYGLDLTATEIVANIINHPFNVCVTCCSKCNDAQNIFFNPVKRDALLRKIIKDLYPILCEKK